jgi:hypothetical protein
MTLPEPSDLSSEEQALAARLVRLGPRAEPSPALDARVLAAAHAAAQTPAARPVLRRRRWPAVVGLAASLVLAVGLAWRLRPQPEPAPAPRYEQVAPMRSVVPAAQPIAPAASSPPSAPAEASRNASAADRTSAVEEKRAAPAKPAQPPAEVESPPTLAAKVVFDAPTSLPPPPPAPPPEAPPDNTARARAAVTAAAPAPPVAPVVQDGAASGANQADAFGSTREGDEPSDEVPPATVDSPVVRDAWLQRIQRLVDAGDIAGARTSLREFERRYPDYVLPEDLRALAR